MSSSSADDNPFQAPKQQPLGRISVKLPTDGWLCQKMDKLNFILRLVEGYPSSASEACGVQKDHFIVLIHPIQWTIANPVGTDRPAKRQKKMFYVSTSQPVPSTSALTRWRVVLPSCLDSMRS